MSTIHQTVVIAVSPAKFILFGEHAVVYGEPAIAVAIDLPLRIIATEAKAFTVDGQALNERSHAYIKRAIDNYWEGGPVAIEIRSDVPRASGLGSSAAVTVATLAALRGLAGEDKIEEEALAKSAFEVEFSVQGRASPTDTSTCTHGNVVMLARKAGENLLWHVQKEDNSWYIHHLDIPDATFVLGNTRQRGRTWEMVAKVRRYYDKSGHARETIREIGDMTLEANKALGKGDLVAIGELMTKNHMRLSSLGVSNKMLEKLVKAVSSHSYGAKLTGAGGGGCMVALTDRPERTAKAIENAGGTPMIVKPSKQGVRIVKK